MSASETVKIANLSATVNGWFEIADASHTVVQFLNTGSPTVVPLLYVGDDEPTSEAGFPAHHVNVKVQNANSKVWAFLRANTSIYVVRGDARITQNA